MKIAICLAALSALVGVCLNQQEITQADNLIEYQVDADRYAVIVVHDGVSSSEAKKIAKVRAAEITVQNGGRYFTIDSQTDEIQVAKTGSAWPNDSKFNQNLYQELIIEKDFGKARVDRDLGENRVEGVYPATRLVFTIYAKKPSGRQSIDACTLTNCNQ